MSLGVPSEQSQSLSPELSEAVNGLRQSFDTFLQQAGNLIDLMRLLSYS